MLWFSLSSLGLFFRIEVQTQTITLARPLFVTSVCLETHIKPHQFFWSFLPYVGHGVCRIQTCDNLLLLPSGKLVVSLTRLEFLLHTYMAFSHEFKLFKGVQTYSRPGETYSVCMHWYKSAFSHNLGAIKYHSSKKKKKRKKRTPEWRSLKLKN